MEFQALFERHYPPLYRYVHRLTGDGDLADDVAQEAFVRLLKQDVPAAEARPWLFTVAMNLVRDGARAVSRRQRLLVATPVSGAQAVLPDEEVVRDEQRSAVRSALERLSERDRRLLMMRAEGFAYREIAGAIGVAESSVGTLVARALRRLAEALDGREDGDDARD